MGNDIRIEDLQEQVRRAVDAAQAQIDAESGGAYEALDRWPPPKGPRALQFFGNEFQDTQELFSAVVDGVRVYDEDRAQQHAGIVDAALGRVTGPGEAEAIFLAGGPASGKTTIKDALHLARTHVDIDPDAFKLRLPEYQVMADASDPYTAYGTHEESSDVARLVLGRAMEAGLPILVDSTGDGKPRAFAEKLQMASEAGYRVHALYVDVPVAVAIERSVDRWRGGGRFLSPTFVVDIHASVSARFQEIEDQDFVETIEVLDGTSAQSERERVYVARRRASQELQVADAVRWEAFRLNAQLN